MLSTALAILMVASFAVVRLATLSHHGVGVAAQVVVDTDAH
jgi:hypothetical protein